jgi:tRNA dimethylallyltransferase
VSVAPPLLVIAGATATGKTGLSIEVADAMRAEGTPVTIISADSRQVYRGLDIGTAKIPLGERRGIPHAGLDLVDPDASFSVADFARHVSDVLARIAQERGLAILVGGTGLYLRAATGRIDPVGLPSDRVARARVEAFIADRGLEAAVARLHELAPGLAARTDLRNPRRVSRALEVAEVGGDLPAPAAPGYGGPIAWLGLRVAGSTHRAWIARRARGQFEAGLIEEARRLRERFDPDLPAFSAIGYREAWDVLDGVATLEEAIERDAARNVAFAKRQATWFRAEPGIGWLDPTAGDSVRAALATARALAARAGVGDAAAAGDPTSPVH